MMTLPTFKVTVEIKGNRKLTTKDVRSYIKNALKNYYEFDNACYGNFVDIESMLDRDSLKVE